MRFYIDLLELTGKRKLWIVVHLLLALFGLSGLVYALHIGYRNYSDAESFYRDACMRISGQNGYASTGVISLYGQNDWQSFIEIGAGDMVDVVVYYNNYKFDEPQEACMLVKLSPILDYVHGSAMFQSANSSEWESFSESSDIDAFFTRGVHLGTCPPGQRLGFRFTVAIKPAEIETNKDMLMPIDCYVYQYGDTKSTTHSTVGICHRTSDRLAAFLYSCRGFLLDFDIYGYISIAIMLLFAIMLPLTVGGMLIVAEVKSQREERE